jgi:hypothetical protein
VSLFSRRRIRRNRKGDFEIHLETEERELLSALPEQLRELLADDDPSVFRLFPSAYTDDPERDAEFHRLMREDLLAHHLGALEVLEKTASAEQLDEEQMVGWMQALNSLRLVLGTRLEVTEEMYEQPIDPDDPRAPLFAVYSYLGWLQEEIVEALSG